MVDNPICGASSTSSPRYDRGVSDSDQAAVAQRIGEFINPKAVRKSLRKHVGRLAEILHDGEEVRGAVMGIVDGSTRKRLVVVTDRRFVSLALRVGGATEHSIPLGEVASVSGSTGMMKGSLMISTTGSGPGIALKTVDKKQQEAFTSAANDAIADGRLH